MKLVRIGGDPCGKDDCPTVFLDEDDDSIVVRGDELPEHEKQDVVLAPGETVVRIPKAVLLEAAEKVGASA